MRMSKPVLGASTLAMLLGGCTTLGTNVSGDFRCDRPDGVCAPSTVIDDQAIATIANTTSTELMMPAGPYTVDDGMEPQVSGTTLASAPVSNAARPSYQLTIVFPEYVDGQGNRYHRSSVVADVNLPGRGDMVDQLANRQNRRSRSGLLAAAESAPPYLAVQAEALMQEGPASPQPASAPESSGQVAALSAPAQPNPIERIKAEVDAKVADAAQSRPRRQAASFPGSPNEE